MIRRGIGRAVPAFALVNGVSFEFARSIFTGEANLTRIIGGMFGLQARPDSNTSFPPFLRNRSVYLVNARFGNLAFGTSASPPASLVPVLFVPYNTGCSQRQCGKCKILFVQFKRESTERGFWRMQVKPFCLEMLVSFPILSSSVRADSWAYRMAEFCAAIAMSIFRALILKPRPQNGGFGRFQPLFCGESLTFMEEHGHGLNCFKRPSQMLQSDPLP